MDNKTRFYKFWALIGTALCIGLAIYVIAAPSQRAGTEDGGAELGPGEGFVEGSPEATSGDAPSEVVAAPLPEELRGLAREWMSATYTSELRGHAVLLDLEQRHELLIERCQHPGYDAGPGETQPEFCESVVAARILAVESGALTLQGRGAEEGRATLEISGAGASSRLTLTLGEERFSLVPGSKNDLYQRMEAEPAMMEAKRQWIQRNLEEESARRRALETRE